MPNLSALSEKKTYKIKVEFRLKENQYVSHFYDVRSINQAQLCVGIHKLIDKLKKHGANFSTNKFGRVAYIAIPPAAIIKIVATQQKEVT